MRKASIALLAGLTFAAPAVALAAPERPVAAQVVVSDKAPAPAEAPDKSNYAERETANQQVAEYEGGQTVIVFSGAAFVALLLLLLLI